MGFRCSLPRRWSRSLVAGMLVVLACARPLAALPVDTGRREPRRPPMASGEIVVRLRSDFPACAHCLLARDGRLRGATGTGILDEVRRRHAVTAMEPLFGGVHAAQRHKLAQRRFGRSGRDSEAELSQIYVIRFDSKDDPLKVAADFRRDPNVVSAEPNYVYSVKGELETVEAAARAGVDAGTSAAAAGAGAGFAEGNSDSLPNDPLLHSSGSWGQDFPDLWGLFRIHAPEAWDLSKGEGVIVAVVDSGMDIEHPDLAANVWHNEAEIAGNGIDDDGNGFVDDVNGWDFTTCKGSDTSGRCRTAKERGPDVIDEAGHGTHVAGTIAAVGDNGIGMIGVAPEARVMAVKGINAQGLGTITDLAAAMVYAAENGARVINTSWGGSPSDTIREAVEYVTSALDAVVVASVGNGGAPLERGEYPANLPTVIAVGATTQRDEVAAFSNFGGPLDVVGPGGGDSEPSTVVDPQRSVLSLLSGDAKVVEYWSSMCRCVYRCGTPQCCADPECEPECEIVCEPGPWVIEAEYVRGSGTSFAAPHVAGVAALVRSRHPEFTAEQVRQAIRNSAEDLGPAGWDERYGYGRVNAKRAVEVEDTPIAEIASPENRGKVWERNFPLSVRGNVKGDGSGLRDWRLTIRPAAGGAPVVVSAGYKEVGEGVLGQVDLGGRFGLEAGKRYVLELEATDNAGHTARDSKVFLIPNPKFAAVPVPDPFDLGDGDPSMSADGQSVVFHLRDLELSRFGTSVWYFNAPSHTLTRLGPGGLGRLSPDGQMVLYYAAGWRMRHMVASFEFALDLPPFNPCSYPLTLSKFGSRVGFLAARVLHAEENQDRSCELFIFTSPHGPLRQVTHGPQVDRYNEIENLVGTPDGRRFVFLARTNLDRSASTGSKVQVFSYDDDMGVVRQLTGRQPGVPSGGNRPTISADGSRIAYEHDGIFMIDVRSGGIHQIVNNDGFPTVPLLSGDGTHLAFIANLDLDPEVVNEDLSPEVFLMDLSSRRVTQVTDSRDPYVRYGTQIDQTGSTILTYASDLNGTGLHAGLSRFVRRQPPYSSPKIEVPEAITVSEGKTSHVEFRAGDGDRSSLTFHVETAPPGEPRLGKLLRSVLTQEDGSSADWEVTPCYGTAGSYRLKVAGFDAAGEVSIREAVLEVTRSAPDPDVNRDSRVGGEDFLAMINELFSLLVESSLFPFSDGTCSWGDQNDDGALSVADVVAWVRNQ